MCTVTFVPAGKQIFLTSNRDEKHWRAAAHLPEAYPSKTGHIIYPKDGDAGGTWFAVHENGNAVVFLNGGFIKHAPQHPYRKSRGLILLEMLDQHSPIAAFDKMELGNIEPFTAVVWDDQRLFECRWDGQQKHEQSLASNQPHIWSSVTLYDPDVIIKRKNWFVEWLQLHPHPTQEEILAFHQFTGDGDAHNDLMMNRDGMVFTVSVTSAAIGAEKVTFEYVDVKEHQTSKRDFPIINASVKA